MRHRVGFGEQALGLDGRHDGNGKTIDQVDKFLPALGVLLIVQGPAATVAQENQGPLRPDEFFQGLPGGVKSEQWGTVR